MCELLADPCLSLPPFTGRKPLSFHSQAVLPSTPNPHCCHSQGDLGHWCLHSSLYMENETTEYAEKYGKIGLILNRNWEGLLVAQTSVSLFIVIEVPLKQNQT